MPDWVRRGPDNPDSRDRPREAGEGTGWPKDKPGAKPDKPRTDAERIKDLESELAAAKSENRRLTADYERSLRERDKTRSELSAEQAERRKLADSNSRLTDTNSRLVSDNMALRKKTSSSSVLEGKEGSAERQKEIAQDKPKHRNWFPTDKVGGLGGAVAGVAGSYAVWGGRVGSKAEAFALACAGAGVAALGVGREVTDKINDWRDKKAEKKNADRQQAQ